MKKVIYMPRRSGGAGGGSGNININTEICSYLDWDVSIPDGLNRTRIIKPFSYWGCLGGGRVNFVSVEQNSNNANRIDVRSTLEAYPNWYGIQEILNADDQGHYVSSAKAYGMETPFYTGDDAMNWNDGPVRTYFPNYYESGFGWDLIVTFRGYNFHTGEPLNTAVMVNAQNVINNHTPYVMYPQYFNNGLSFGAHIYGQTPNLEMWKALYNSLNDYTTQEFNQPLNSFSPAQCRMTFVQALGNDYTPQYANINGVNYDFYDCYFNIESVGYNVSDFDRIDYI